MIVYYSKQCVSVLIHDNIKQPHTHYTSTYTVYTSTYTVYTSTYTDYTSDDNTTYTPCTCRNIVVLLVRPSMVIAHV